MPDPQEPATDHARLLLVRTHEGVHVTGFQAGVLALDPARGSVSLGRVRSCDVWIQGKTAAVGVIGGYRGYILRPEGGGWVLYHTGHITEFLVNGQRKGWRDNRVRLKDGDEIALLTSEKVEALVLRYREAG